MAIKSPNVDVTSRFAEFVANVGPKALTADMVVRLKEYLLDYIGVAVAGSHSWESIPQIVSGINGIGARGGSSTAILKGNDYLPQFAGLLNATFGHAMDFDDTYAPGSLHPGVCAFAASLAQAEQSNNQDNKGDRLLLAAAVGYEVICRLGAELGNAAYQRGFHNTSTAGIFGAVAAIAVLKRLSASTIENAFGLALSKAAGSMQYLENGSSNKRLHPGFAVHDAFVSVALAEAGVVGASKSIEGASGLLHAYSPKTEHNLAQLTADLGTRWDFLETSIKPYAACRMTHGVIEHGAKISASTDSRVEKLFVSLSPENYVVVGKRTPNKLHPNNVVDAQFSIYFQLAYSWLYGSASGVEFASKIHDEELRKLSEKIECCKDHSVVEFGSKLRAVFADGTETSVDIPFPLGEPQHPFGPELLNTKYRALATPALGPTRTEQVKEIIENIENHSVHELLGLLSQEY